MVLTPEMKLKNIASVVLADTEVVRTHNGCGRCATYVGSVDKIALSSRHLANTIIAYLNGELKPEDIGDVPF